MPTPKSPRHWFTRTSRPEPTQSRRHRPQLEWCEPRTLLTAFTVNALTDTGAGSGTTGDLRYCITQADNDTSNDTINITATGTIQLTGALPALTGSRTIAFAGPGAASLTVKGGGSSSNYTIMTVNSGTTTTLSGLTIANGNSASGAGGISNQGMLTLDSTTLMGNTGQAGAAITTGGTLTVTNSTFTSNVGGANGIAGAIYSYAGTTTVNGSTFAKNSAPFGGAISNAARMTVSGSTFTGNSAGQIGGGGILNFTGGTLTVRNSTLTGNSTTGDGGGIASTDGTTTIINSTITGNSTTHSGGGLANSATMILVNTIVAGNTSSNSATVADIAGPIAASSHNNLIGTGGSGGLTNGTSGNKINVANPGLGTLGSYGGPTQTIPLLANSPALDAASDTDAGLTDERGAQRGPLGLDAGTHADIGAYEDTSSYLVTTTADTTAAGTLRAGVGWANLNTNPRTSTDPNTVRFDTANTFSTPQTIALNSALGSLAFNGTKVAEAITGPGSANVTIQGGGTSSNFSDLTVARGTTASLANLTVTGGNATGAAGVLAGGLYNQGNVTLANMTFRGNVGYTGGAVRNDGTLTVNGSTFSGNTASFGGAGLFNAGSMTVTGSTIANNVTSNVGGGFYNGGGGTLALTSSTISGNSAINGGGIESINSGTVLNLVNTTIAYNSASNQGGGIDNQGLPANLFNTIVAANTRTGSTAASDISGSVNPGTATSGSRNNLIGTGGAGGLTNGSAGNLVGVASPKLGTLGNYGGPTQTIPLLPGSPALDAGGIDRYTNVTTDQRGAQLGPNGLDAGTQLDIGAYEDTSSYVVTSQADSLAVGTLRSAIGWANLNSNPRTTTDPNTVRLNALGTITLDPSLGSLALSGSKVAESIVGSGASALTVQGGGAASNFSIFAINAGTTASLTGLTISGGRAVNGGGINNAGNLTLSNSILSGNSVSLNGGGLYNATTSTAAVSSTTFQNNSAVEPDPIISGNTTTYPPRTSGGGIYNASNNATSVNNSTFTGNSADFGGGIDNDSNASIMVGNSTFTGNSADYGGGIENYGTGTLTINSSTFTHNSAAFGGGALHVSAGNVTVNGSTFASNSAVARGGAIDDVSTGMVTVNGSTMTGNSGGDSGGAIFTYLDSGGQFKLIGSTVTANSASDGGAILTGGTGAVTISGSTIVRNSASATAGGIDVGSPNSMTLVNTIVAANTFNDATHETSTPSDIVGTVVATSHNNLVGSNGGAGGLVNGGSTHNIIYNFVSLIYLGLGTLGNYGGSVQTIPLLPGSLAIGAGDTAATTTATDERGKPRTVNGVTDIGAFQSQGFTLSPPPYSTPQTSKNGQYFVNPLAVFVSSPVGDPVAGGLVSYTVNPVNGAGATLDFTQSAIFSYGSNLSYAAVSATPNGVVGTYTVTASASGGSPVTFTLTNTAVPAGTPTGTRAGAGSPMSDPGDSDVTFPLIEPATVPDDTTTTPSPTPTPTPSPTPTPTPSPTPSPTPTAPLTTLAKIQAYNAHPIPFWLELANIRYGDHPTRAQIRAATHPATTTVQHARHVPAGPTQKTVAAKHPVSHAARSTHARF